MKKLLVALSIAVTAGCASDPKVSEPVPFSTNHSFAYNVAAQTDLLSDHSPLKDFTQEEVEENKAKLKEVSSPAKYFGVAYMLMGNLTGIIDIAGGGITDMALSNHTASKSRWIVMLPKNQFGTAKEAQDYIKGSIETAGIDVLSKFGIVSKNVNPKSGLYNYQITIDNKTVPVGLVGKVDDSKVSVQENKSFYDSQTEYQPAFTYGLTEDSKLIQNIIITTPTISIANVEAGKSLMTQDALNLAITQKLPKGFYLYSPSLPRSQANGKTYTDMSIQTPAIYTQGHKYEFVKP